MRLADAPYHGWTNYETYAVFTAFNNDTKFNRKLKKAVKEIESCSCSKIEKMKTLVSVLKEIFEEENRIKSSPYLELVDHAAESINWKEVAGRLNVI